MAKPELGTKRQCQNCGTKFYDLDKDPIVCPKCGTVFQAAALRSRAAAVARKDEDEEVEIEPAAANAEFVPLEDADAPDDAKVATDDVEIDEDIGGEDETFLEPDEEDGDDDVADLIDGDLDDDEEG